MSQPEKNKENPIISYMSKKRRFKIKFRNKESDNVSGYQANSNINERRQKDWFTDQYEKLIGKPPPTKELSTDEVLRKLQESTKYRWVPEANTYKSLAPQPSNVHNIEWRDPLAKVCKCPDTDCTCSGNIMLPRKKIPHGQRYIKSPWIRKLVHRFRRPSPPPTESFVQRLAAVVGVEAAVYQDLEKSGILNIRGAEFCMSRCIRYYGAGNMPTTKNFMDNQNFQSYETSLNENEEEDDQICDSCCTVSTQSTVGPTGELVIGDYSHVLYSTLGEAIVRDIEGTELKILSYKSADDSFEHKSHNLCSFDKIFGIRKLINLKELKNQISLLKQHIYTSIFEIQEKCSLAGTISTRQYEEGHVNNEDSSEDITIPTPYMGVVLKAKKKPQECPAGNQPPHVSPINDETVRETLPEQLIPRTSEINNVSIDIPNIINAKKEVTEEPASQQKIEVTTSGVEIENQKRTFSEECCISILDSPVNTICDLNHNETNECASPMPIKSFSICEETVNESLSAKKCLDSFKEIAGITKYQKQSNDEITESGDSRKKSNKIPEIETHTKQTNHFFKKRVYGISIDQLQNMNNKKFIKCVSNKSCVFIYRNNEKANQKGLQAEGNKSIQRIRERKSEENCRENDSEIKSPPKIFSVEGAKIKAQLIHSKLLSYFKMKSNQNINIPITGTQDNCHKLSDNSSLSIKKGIKIVESDNTNIVKPSLQQIEICNIENKSKKSQHFTLTNSGLKIDPNPKYNSNKSTTLLKGNESVEQSIHKDNVEQQENCFTDSKMKVEVTLGVENTVKSEVSKKAHLLTKKVSNLSSVLKRILRGKMHKSVKSLPEPTVHRSFRESCQTQINVGEIERKTYINNSKKRGGEPKTSEREMFSIQYSAISEIKCSSKFLKIGKEQSYAEEQEVHGIRGPVPEGIRRLTA